MLNCTKWTGFAQRIKKSLFPGHFCLGNRDLLNFVLFVEGRIGKVNVLLVHALFGKGNRFAKAYRGKKTFRQKMDS